MGEFLERNYRVGVTLLILGIVLLSFFLGVEEGRLSGSKSVLLTCSDEVLETLAIRKESTDFETGEVPVPALQSSQVDQAGSLSGEVLGAFVGSKNGTKYYRPDCSGIQRIKPENYIWFSTEEDAQLQGYTAASC